MARPYGKVERLEDDGYMMNVMQIPGSTGAPLAAPTAGKTDLLEEGQSCAASDTSLEDTSILMESSYEDEDDEEGEGHAIYQPSSFGRCKKLAFFGLTFLLIALVTALQQYAFFSTQEQESVSAVAGNGGHCELLPPSIQKDENNLTFLDVNYDEDDTAFCVDHIQNHKCHCISPTEPIKPYAEDSDTYQARTWPGAFYLNKGLVQAAINGSLDVVGQLDVVFYGDSITEHWNGRDLGEKRDKWDDVNQVFLDLFHKDNNASVEGLALGIGGDRCQNLLYRIQNGELPKELTPKVFWLLIGTNDMGGDHCLPEAITAGNIRIVEEIRSRHPKTPIVINSLLPRGIMELTQDNGWEVLSSVNHQLECYAKNQTNVEFYNATNLFAYHNATGGEFIKQNLFTKNDWVHPSAEGARIWGEAIIEKIISMR